MAQPKHRKVSNPLGLAVLALLRERPMHPYEMASTLRERAKEESIKLNYGSLYTVIAALDREGLILARETTREGARPERTIYALTDEGQLALRNWMRELLGIPVKEYPQFEAALSLMPVLPPDEVVGLLEDRIKRLDVEVASRRSALEVAIKQGLDRLFAIELEYHVAMREAERAWVADLVELIRTSPDFTRGWRTFHDQPQESTTAQSPNEEDQDQ